MTADTLDDYRWLVSGDATNWLDDLANDTRPLVQQVQYLRKRLSARQTHLVLELVELRRRAIAKYEAAAQMFFTARALEQATDQWIAAYKAERFPAGVPIADLCCGVGGDLIGLARSDNDVTGIDSDPIVATLADANCRVLAIANARVQQNDADRVDLKKFAAWHIDPDRRVQERRTTNLHFFSPSLKTIDQMRRQLPHLALKLAPATELPEHWQAATERQWIGRQRECKQQIAWFGDLARFPGQHTATVIDSSGKSTPLLVGQPYQPIDVAPDIGDFVLEPHAVVIAARLVGELARQCDLLAVDPAVAYMTSDAAIDHPLLSRFQVLETVAFDMRQLKATLHRRDIGQLEVKKRGVDISPAAVKRQLDGKGRQQATLILTPQSGAIRAVLCQRCEAKRGDST